MTDEQTQAAATAPTKPHRPWWRRFRYWFILGGSIAVAAALLLTDPDKGLSTGMLLLALVTPLLAVLFAHWSRKALHDYPEADMRRLFWRASQSPVGAGLALVALAIVLSALLGLFGRSAHAAPAGPHPKALPMAPVIRAEIAAHWAELPWPHYVPALIEHESCLSLTHPRCWEPTSRLKTSREEGAGLGQLTRAWRPDGSLRFDALQDLRSRHPALRELDWATIYQRPDLQIRSIVVMSAEAWRALRGVKDFWERLAFADAAYNGGLGGVSQERRACGLREGCDPQRWFGGVERVCLKSRQPMYGGRSACDINRHHVSDVLTARMPRYRRVFS